jgi:hypothetical protein
VVSNFSNPFRLPYFISENMTANPAAIVVLSRFVGVKEAEILHLHALSEGMAVSDPNEAWRQLYMEFL